MRKRWSLGFACVLLLLLANCSLTRMTSRAKEEQSLNVMWLSPVIAKGPCVDSIISEARQADNCLSWTRRETAGPSLDAVREVVYVGGSDALLHVMSSNDGVLKTTVKLPGNLRARPLLVDDTLFFGTDNGAVLSVDANTLATNWRINVDAEVENQIAISGSTLYLVTGLSTIYAIDRKDGSIKWYKKRPLPSSILVGVQSNPLLIKLKEDESSTMVLACGHPSGRVDFYDAKNGKPLFDVMVGDPSADFPDVAAEPVWAEDSVVVASFNRGIVSLDPLTGSVRWRLAENEKTRLLAADGLVFAAGGKSVVAVDAKRGDVKWRFVFDKGAPSRLVVKDGLLYFASDRNALFVLDAQSGRPVRYIGSGLGFAGDFDFSSNTLFAVSTAGYLYAMSPNFKGIVQRGSSFYTMPY